MAGRATGGGFRSRNLEVPGLQIGNANDAPNPPGVDELKSTCRNASLVHELCEALHLAEGGVFRGLITDHHHHQADGAFILPE